MVYDIFFIHFRILSFNGKVTNGFVEGMNNKIKPIKRKGFGFNEG